MAKPLELNIMMLGGRRAGKTSTLAAMQHCFDKEFKGTDLNIIQADQTTGDVIQRKQQELENYLGFASKNKNFTPDSTPTQGEDTYVFDVKIKGKPDTIKLRFYDFNGEWLAIGNSNYGIVEEKIRESDILMIIIDTPYLMEEDGQYNSVRNRAQRITNAIKKELDFKKSGPPKMVMFVPIKCEKYYDEGKMQEVCEAIQKDRCYGDLIDYLKGSCEVAITPILTIGTAAFIGFGFDKETGEMLMQQESDGMPLPSKPLYGFTQKAQEAARRQGLGRKYSAEPVFCEQPAVYTLQYALTYAAKVADMRATEAKKGFWGIFDPKHGEALVMLAKEIFKIPLLDQIPTAILDGWIEKLRDRYDFASSADYLKQRDLVREKLKTHGDGYEIISDVLYFKGK